MDDLKSRDEAAAAPAAGAPVAGDAVHEAYRTVQQFVHWLEVCSCGDGGAAAVLAPLKEALQRFGDDGWLVAGAVVDHWVYLLDVWRLTNHASSVHGSWLTAAGERLRDALGLIDVARYEFVVEGPWWEQEGRLQPDGAELSYGVWVADEDRAVSEAARKRMSR